MTKEKDQWIQNNKSSIRNHKSSYTSITKCSSVSSNFTRNTKQLNLQHIMHFKYRAFNYQIAQVLQDVFQSFILC